MFIWGILLALLILNILVVLHEFGHFAVAKFRGVTVFEFGIGIPPRMGSVWTNSKQFNVARLPMIQERLIKKGSIISIAARAKTVSCTLRMLLPVGKSPPNSPRMTTPRSLSVKLKEAIRSKQ